MDLKTMKKLAEQEIYRYRDNCAYLQGILDACGDSAKAISHSRVRWLLAVDLAKEYWTKKDPEKASFFSAYYRLDRPRKRYELKPTITALAMQMHLSEPTLYNWRNELITTVVLAAIQTGALRPYGVPAAEKTASPTPSRASRTDLPATHGNE